MVDPHLLGQPPELVVFGTDEAAAHVDGHPTLGRVRPDPAPDPVACLEDDDGPPGLASADGPRSARPGRHRRRRRRPLSVRSAAWPTPDPGPSPVPSRTVLQGDPIEHRSAGARMGAGRDRPLWVGAALLHERREVCDVRIRDDHQRGGRADGGHLRRPQPRHRRGLRPGARMLAPATRCRLRRGRQGGPGMEDGRGGPARRAAAGVRGVDGAGGHRALPDAHGRAGQAPERRRHRGVRRPPSGASTSPTSRSHPR